MVPEIDRRHWYRANCTAVDLCVMDVQGDSVTSTQKHGDVILVHALWCSPVPPGLFALHAGMGLVAKRLEYVPLSEPPRVSIISDNQHYSPYECTAEEVNIVGRVRWYGQEVQLIEVFS